MKRIMFSSAIAASLLLAGCGEETSDPNERETTTASETETTDTTTQESPDEESVEEPEEPEEPSVGVRSNPLPMGDTITADEVLYDDSSEGYEVLLDLTVTEVLRGQEAWDIILAENQFNEVPAEGYEYIMVKVKGHVQNAATDDYPFWFSTMNFDFVDESGAQYENVSTVTPNELSSEIYNGGTAEGYISNQVKVDEKVYLTYSSYSGAPIFFETE